jgi:Tol biopolymer transport system component
MSVDLRKRLAKANDLGAPDLWQEIGSRVDRGVGPMPVEQIVTRDRRHRLAAAAVALVVFAVAGAFAWTALSPESPDGAGRPPGSPVAAVTVGGVTLLAAATPSNEYHQALLKGRLDTTGGCVSASSAIVIWPAGYELTSQAGETWVVDASGAVVTRMGAVVRLGGNGTDLATAERLVAGGVPAGCKGAGRFWLAAPLVGSHIPPNPCALLTDDEVATATGANVVSSGLVPDSRMPRPGAPNPCEYKTDGTFGSVITSVRPQGIQEFLDLRSRDPLNVTPVRGLGDAAFTTGGGSIFVRVGDSYFSIGVQLDPGSDAIPVLRELAAQALSHLSPVGTPPLSGAKNSTTATDNQRIFYTVRNDDTGQERFYSMASSGSDRQRFARNIPGANDAALSPDGSQIAFSRNDGTASAPDTHIYVASADGSNVHAVTEAPSDGSRVSEETPAWSPDGTAITFVTNRSGNIVIWSVAPDGSSLHPFITQGTYDASPVWSPDGSKIAFLSDEGEPAPGHFGDRIWIANADGSDAHIVMPDSGGGDNDVSWSPAGTSLVFERETPLGPLDSVGASQNGDYRFQIMEVNTDGSGLLALTDGSKMDGSPVFSPDGTSVFFSRRLSDRSTASDIYELNLADGSVTRITHEAPMNAYPRNG